MYESNKNQSQNKNNSDYNQKKQNGGGNYYKNKGRNDYESVCPPEDVQERMKIVQKQAMNNNKNKDQGSRHASQDNCKCLLLIRH